MPRWEPNARERLERAAMELYAERGFEQTTVAEIAERAGLTERTFFRHFADKRDVLFSGAIALQELMVGAVAAMPDQAGPVESVTAGLEAAGDLLQGRRAFALQRQAIIAVNPQLQERELIKLATLSAALAEVLRERGVEEAAATLTGEYAIAVFKAAFVRWIDDGDRHELTHLIRASLEELRMLTGAAPALA
jgi:AcrR family transcriptional regulator